MPIVMFTVWSGTIVPSVVLHPCKVYERDVVTGYTGSTNVLSATLEILLEVFEEPFQEEKFPEL